MPTYQDNGLPYGLGRKPAPDSRDWPMRLALPAPPRELDLPLRRRWRRGPTLDQGTTSECVGYSWRARLNAAPVRTKAGPAPYDIYTAAQEVDEWPGQDYLGTSVRAGAKVLQELGYLESYVWAANLEEVVAFLLTAGPVCFGTSWRKGMFTPTPEGQVIPSGPAAGGHAYLAYGADRMLGRIHFQNSWGTGYGLGGLFWMTFADAARLLADGGEACAPTEGLR